MNFVFSMSTMSCFIGPRISRNISSMVAQINAFVDRNKVLEEVSKDRIF